MIHVRRPARDHRGSVGERGSRGRAPRAAPRRHPPRPRRRRRRPGTVRSCRRHRCPRPARARRSSPRSRAPTSQREVRRAPAPPRVRADLHRPLATRHPRSAPGFRRRTTSITSRATFSTSPSSTSARFLDRNADKRGCRRAPEHRDARHQPHLVAILARHRRPASHYPRRRPRARRSPPSSPPCPGTRRQLAALHGRQLRAHAIDLSGSAHRCASPPSHSPPSPSNPSFVARHRAQRRRTLKPAPASPLPPRPPSPFPSPLASAASLLASAPDAALRPHPALRHRLRNRHPIHRHHDPVH